MTVQRYKIGPRMSQGVQSQGLLFTSAQVANDFKVDAAEQTRQVLAKIDGLLAEAGSGKERVLQATILLSSMEHYAAMNAVWDAWVAPGAPPTRLCYETKFSLTTILVEIAVVAVA